MSLRSSLIGQLALIISSIDHMQMVENMRTIPSGHVSILGTIINYNKRYTVLRACTISTRTLVGARTERLDRPKAWIFDSLEEPSRLDGFRSLTSH